MADRAETVAGEASLVEDVWLALECRLRARRVAPFEPARVRILFHPDRGATLDDAPLRSFLEALGSRADVLAFEPRGQGGSGGRFGPGIVEDFRAVVDGAGRRWGDGLPLVVAGHGLGGSLAVAIGDHPGVRGVAALAPLVPPSDDAQALEIVAGLDLPRRVPALQVPLLVVAPRDDPAGNHGAIAALASAQPRAALLAVPGDHGAPLRAPWQDVLSEWATWVVTQH